MVVTVCAENLLNDMHDAVNMFLVSVLEVTIHFGSKKYLDA